ncbi:hypothetical protein BDR04DRAFT_1156872 [Suillus decipiens]|nr:hypothetical protein BDR04DRAFT_1156872 [Suillus decipiens]
MSSNILVPATPLSMSNVSISTESSITDFPDTTDTLATPIHQHSPITRDYARPITVITTSAEDHGCDTNTKCFMHYLDDLEEYTFIEAILMCEEYAIEIDNIIVHRDAFATSLIIHIIRNAILLEIWARRISCQETCLSIMHLQRHIRTHALHLLPRGFVEDLREAIQHVNARAEGTHRPHSPSNDVETNQIALTDTAFPQNPHSNISNLVSLLAAIQEVSNTTSTIVQDIQQSTNTSTNARQAITDVVNVLCNQEVECTPSPVQMIDLIKTIIQQQSTPPSYRRSTAPSSKPIRTWTEEHPTRLYNPAPEFLPPVVVQLPEFVPVAALGAMSPLSPGELITAAEKEDMKPEPEPVPECPFQTCIPKQSHLIMKTRVAGKRHQSQSQDPAYSNVAVAPPLCASTSNPDKNHTCQICKGTGHCHKTCDQYHCVYCHVIAPRHLSIYCPLLKGKDVEFPIKDFKHPDFYAMLAAWELEEDEKYACACQEQDKARAIENDYDEDGHFISDNPIYWVNQDE